MAIFECLSQIKEPKPFVISSELGSVSSVEGFIYKCFTNPLIGYKIYQEGVFIDWVELELCLTHMASELRSDRDKLPVYVGFVKMFSYLELCKKWSTDGLLKKIADEAYEEGEFNFSADLYLKLLEQEINLACMNNLAICYMRLGDYQKAYEILEQGLLISHEKSLIQNYLYTCYQLFGSAYAIEKALVFMKEETTPFLIEFCSRHYERLNKFEEAIAGYEVLRMQEKVYLLQNENQKYENYIERRLLEQEVGVNDYCDYVMYCLLQNKSMKALEYLNKACALDPENLKVQLLKAQLAKKANQRNLFKTDMEALSNRLIAQVRKMYG